MALEKFRASPLPNPGPQYDPQYIRQLIRVLELYFSQLDSATPNYAQSYRADQFIGGGFTGTNVTADSVDTTLLSADNALIGYERANGVWTDALISYGHRNERQISNDIMVDNAYGTKFYGNGENIYVPYNQLQSSQTQTAANTYTAYTLTYNVNNFPDGISIVSSSRITFAHAGIYSIAYSIQLKNTHIEIETFDIWLRYNGSDVANTNTRFAIAPRKSAVIPSYSVAETTLLADIAVDGAYIELAWHVTNTAVTIEALPAVAFSAGVTPAIPATPSVIVTIGFVSAKFPEPTYVAPLPVFGFGSVGNITVSIT